VGILLFWPIERSGCRNEQSDSTTKKCHRPAGHRRSGRDLALWGCHPLSYGQHQDSRSSGGTKRRLDMVGSGMKLLAKDYFSRREAETISLGRELSKEFIGNEVVLLSGGLGSGKTVFTKGIAVGLDIEDIHQVRSPSYTLINIYEARYPLFHIDFYRLQNEREIDELGWEEFLGRGVIVVEWAEKMNFAEEAIHVSFEITASSERQIRFSTESPVLASLFP
jgi:tRNA threonylcarbamoyladenosine biosynthesis protein TsaE